jgi:fructosamine-3-kinase
MADSQGMTMLIDPAVYVGHHEADLAMTESCLVDCIQLQ